MSLGYFMQGCLTVCQALLARATGRCPLVTSSLLLALAEQVTAPIKQCSILLLTLLPPLRAAGPGSGAERYVPR